MILVCRRLPRALSLDTSSSGIPKMCPSLNRAWWTSVTKLSLHTKPRMPPCDFTPERYQSLAYNRVLEIHKQHLSPKLEAYFPKPLLLHQGHMQWLFDYEGNRYLDFFSGIVTVSVGHCHPKVNAAAQKQLGRLWHTSTFFFHPPIHEYVEKLAVLLPEPLKVIFLVNSGSEANDLAMTMARAHSNNTDIISFRGAYHGCSPYTLGLTNIGHLKMELASGIGCQSTMCPDVFRGPWGGDRCRDSPVQTIRKCSCAPDCCQAKVQYIEQFKDTLITSVAKSIAGFFAEPIQGVNGFVQYPKGFLKEAFELVREKGGVCIVDEVQTGFGRLGSHFWGFQTHGVLPDIVTMAKGIGNGFPMAAVVTTPEIAKSFTKRQFHFNTFGGGPMACAIGSAVLEVIKEENLQENSQEVGTYMLLKFAKLRDEFEIIGDVRGKGLMIGIEMVKDKTSRQPLPCEEVNQIHEDCRHMGLLVGRGGIFSQVTYQHWQAQVILQERWRTAMAGSLMQNWKSVTPVPFTIRQGDAETTLSLPVPWKAKYAQDPGMALPGGHGLRLLLVTPSGLNRSHQQDPHKTFRIAPSMCITKCDVNFAVEVFRSALIQHMERRAK